MSVVPAAIIAAAITGAQVISAGGEVSEEAEWDLLHSSEVEGEGVALGGHQVEHSNASLASLKDCCPIHAS